MLCLGADISLQMSGEDEYFCGITFLGEISLWLPLLLGFSCFPRKQPELPWWGGVGFSMCWCYFCGIMEHLPCEAPAVPWGWKRHTKGRGVGRTSPSACWEGDFSWDDDSGCIRIALVVEWCLCRWLPPYLGRWEGTIPAWGWCLWLLHPVLLQTHSEDPPGPQVMSLVFYPFTAEAAGVLLLQKLPMTWRLKQILSVWKLNQTRVIDPGPCGLCLVHPTKEEMSQPQQPLLPAVSIPGGCTEESEAQHCEKPGSPWGWRGKGNERIFQINKYTSQEKLFPRMCKELPAIS